MLIHTNCVSREKRGLKSLPQKLGGSLSDPEIRIPSHRNPRRDAFMILIQFPLPPFKQPQQWKYFWKLFSFSLCLQVKQDLRFKGGGRVIVKHICPCFYQYLLNNFTNIQIRQEKFISQIRSHPKWSRILLLKEITKSEMFKHYDPFIYVHEVRYILS